MENKARVRPQRWQDDRGQIVSHAVAPAREIDAISAFILGGTTMPDLNTFTSACKHDIRSEPSAEPIIIAAEQALQKLRAAQSDD